MPHGKGAAGVGWGVGGSLRLSASSLASQTETPTETAPAACAFPVPEFLVGLGQVLINNAQVSVISQKHLVGSCVLQHLCNGTKISALVCGELASCRQVNDVKCVRSHDGRIHVAIVKQVTNNLGTDEGDRRVSGNPFTTEATNDSASKENQTNAAL